MNATIRKPRPLVLEATRRTRKPRAGRLVFVTAQEPGGWLYAGQGLWAWIPETTKRASQ